MRLLLLCLTLLTLPLAAAAQDEESDRGFIQGLLEDALSAEGRTVSIQGFEGALSSRATIDRIAISDPDGVWLTAEDVALSWTRAALLRGRIAIDEISVGTLSMPRKPLPAEGEVPAPEARGAFSLPELPVSVRIDQLDLQEVSLGEPVLGEAASFAITGSARLEGGAGEAQLQIDRLDAGGQIALEGSYDNESRDLALDLSVSEPQDGLVTTLIGLPGAPSLELGIEGEGPIDDFTAQIRLASDGEDRLSGTVELDGMQPVQGEEPSQSFRADLSGDIAPLFAPEYRDFFGTDIRLVAEGGRQPDGTIALRTLDLSAESLSLTGAAVIGPDGWPRSFALDGEIAAGGQPVLLPIAGERTLIGQMRLSAGFDADEGEGWQLDAQISDLDRPDIDADSVNLRGSGTIDREAGQVTGDLSLDAAGLDFSDEALAQAVGDRVTGDLTAAWTRDTPIRLTAIDIGGADYGLTGDVTIDPDGDPITVTPDLTLRARDLSRFAAIAQLEGLQGAAGLDLTGSLSPLTGRFDLGLGGTTSDLALGIEQVDPLLAGTGRLRLGAVRDETGTRLDPLRIETPAALIEGNAALRSEGTTANLSALIRDTSLALPGLEGPTSLTADARQDGERWNVTAELDTPGDGALRVNGTARADGTYAEGTVTGAIGDLSAFSTLAGRDLSGAINLDASGSGNPAERSFDVTAETTTRDVAVSLGASQAQLPGTTRLDFSGTRAADGTIGIRQLDIDGPALTASASGDLGPEIGTLELTASIPDTARFIPGVTGQASLDGTARLEGEEWTFDADLSTPGEGRLRAQGTALPDGTSVEGTLRGGIAQLSAFSELAGRPISGAAGFSASASANPSEGSFDLSLGGTLRGLTTGIAQLDTLVPGTNNVELDANRTAEGVLTIERFEITGPQITGSASGSTGAQQNSLQFQARLADLGRLVSDLPGAATIQGSAQQSNGGNWQVSLDGSGPGGVSLDGGGSVAPDASTVALDINGRAALAIVNPRLAPNTLTGFANYNLSMNGPLALSSVSGRITTEGTRLSLPGPGVSLNDITGNIDLSGARAEITLDAALSNGGDIAVRGPITLSPPFNADLRARIDDARLQQANLYETTANGVVTFTGPATGGATIGGSLTLGETELRIPQIGRSFELLDGLEHQAPPPDVRLTLARAGLGPRDNDPGAGSSGDRTAFPLDLTISAPNRIFARGRGLDAELGGSLQLLGTTANVEPQGRFELIRGRLDLLGNRLELDEGAVQLQGDFDPFIRFVATTETEELEITITIEGPASEPELDISSSPSLPQDEVLAQLLFGRDIQSLSALQAVQLAAAIRTLSGQGGLGLTNSLRENLGVDDLDIGITEEGNAEARVGQYLTENIYSEVSVNSDGNTQVNLNLSVTDNVTVRGRAEADGETGIGIFYERDY